MKKLIAVMVLGILIGTASIFAFGIGVQGGGGVGGTHTHLCNALFNQ